MERPRPVMDNANVTVLLFFCHVLSDRRPRFKGRRQEGRGSNTGDSLRQRPFFLTPVSHHYRIRVLCGEPRPLGLLQHVWISSVKK